MQERRVLQRLRPRRLQVEPRQECAEELLRRLPGRGLVGVRGHREVRRGGGARQFDDVAERIDMHRIGQVVGGTAEQRRIDQLLGSRLRRIEQRHEHVGLDRTGVHGLERTGSGREVGRLGAPADDHPPEHVERHHRGLVGVAAAEVGRVGQLLGAVQRRIEHGHERIAERAAHRRIERAGADREVRRVGEAGDHDLAADTDADRGRDVVGAATEVGRVDQLLSARQRRVQPRHHRFEPADRRRGEGAGGGRVVGRVTVGRDRDRAVRRDRQLRQIFAAAATEIGRVAQLLRGRQRRIELRHEQVAAARRRRLERAGRGREHEAVGEADDRHHTVGGDIGVVRDRATGAGHTTEHRRVENAGVDDQRLRPVPLGHGEAEAPGTEQSVGGPDRAAPAIGFDDERGGRRLPHRPDRGVEHQRAVGIEPDPVGAVHVDRDRLQIGAGRQFEVVLEVTVDAVAAHVDAAIQLAVAHRGVRGHVGAPPRRRVAEEEVAPPRQRLLGDRLRPGRGDEVEIQHRAAARSRAVRGGLVQPIARPFASHRRFGEDQPEALAAEQRRRRTELGDEAAWQVPLPEVRHECHRRRHRGLGGRQHSSVARSILAIRRIGRLQQEQSGGGDAARDHDQGADGHQPGQAPAGGQLFPGIRHRGKLTAAAGTAARARRTTVAGR